MNTSYTPGSSSLPESTDSTVTELKTLLAEAEQVLSDTSDTAASGIASLRDRTRAALEKGRETAHVAMEAAKHRAAQADAAVHAHPYIAVGVAAAVGLLLGALLTRSHARCS